jgi:hypothetical protein
MMLVIVGLYNVFRRYQLLMTKYSQIEVWNADEHILQNDIRMGVMKRVNVTESPSYPYSFDGTILTRDTPADPDPVPHPGAIAAPTPSLHSFFCPSQFNSLDCDMFSQYNNGGKATITTALSPANREIVTNITAADSRHEVLRDVSWVELVNFILPSATQIKSQLGSSFLGIVPD